ncbi:DUF4232 domain-containing protein [Kitasatospora camelliae]|uniref:DUF4232 domain-containing protein n=1 Tax=Kitasatospora camelliae TaxID=3156397 RepID=A0AAU8JQD0_9ACTN
MRRRTAVLVAAVLAAGAAASGCGSVAATAGGTTGAASTGPGGTAAPGGSAAPVGSAISDPAPNCVPEQLTWTFRRIDEQPTTTDETPKSRLIATNSGPGPCAVDGYPWFRVSIGKAEDVVAAPGRQVAERLTVRPGGSVRVDLYYSDTPDTSERCFIAASRNPWSAVLPPHSPEGAGPTAVTLTDRQGQAVPLSVCGEDIWMGAPVLG